jgi:hypothetical protein
MFRAPARRTVSGMTGVTGVIVESRYNGPPSSGHGGVAAGRMAGLVDPGAAVVRLLAPIPLSTPLRPGGAADGVVRVCAGTEVVATVAPLSAPLDVGRFEPPRADLIQQAELGWLSVVDGRHPFPTCFGCGPDRPRRDGLGLRPGRVRGTAVCATRWSPPGAGEVPAWLVWAALDCGSAGPVVAFGSRGAPVVTGELAAEIRRPLRGGHTYALMSRLERRSGRKIVTQAALVDDAGRHVAVGVTTWFTLAEERAG